MKRSALALAVTAALAASASVQADTVLYGSARVSVDYANDKGTDTKGVDVVNNDSLIGVRGEEDLGGGLSAVYRYEFIVDTTEGTSGFAASAQPRYVGLSGGFGTLTVGTQETPYNHVGGVVNIFNSVESFAWTGFLGGSFDAFTIDTGSDITFNSNRDGLFSLSNSVYYATPDIKGFSAEAMFVTNGGAAFNKAQGFSDGMDIWNLSAKYTYGPLSAGLSYIALEGDKFYNTTKTQVTDLGLDQWIASVGYAAGPFTLGLIYERGTFNEWGILRGLQVNNVRSFPGSDEAQNWYLAGSYTAGNNVFKAAYGQLDTGIDRNVAGVVYDDKIDNYLLGYQYNFSKRTALWVEYIGRGVDNTVFYQGDRDVVSIGTRVDF